MLNRAIDYTYLAENIILIQLLYAFIPSLFQSEFYDERRRNAVTSAYKPNRLKNHCSWEESMFLPINYYLLKNLVRIS